MLASSKQGRPKEETHHEKTFTAALIALTATSAFAFGGGKDNKMMRGLDLTDEQKVQIQEMREAHARLWSHCANSTCRTSVPC